MDYLTGINKNEVLKFLGCKGGETDESYIKRIDAIEKALIDAALPKVCHTVLKIKSHNPLLFEKTEAVFEGEDIKKHLAECGECIFMAATLGSGADALIRRLSAVNMADAVICDACASSAVENVCDNYCAHLEKAYGARGLYLTERFSPGYGDLPIETQRFFPDILNMQKRIGLCLSRSMLLEPTKSVTALIGISEKKQKKRRISCEGCKSFADCAFRKRGAVCYE